MNPQAILDKIGEDARASAEQILLDARSRITEAQLGSKQRIEALHADTIRSAEQESEQLAQRMRRMAQLESRKELLGKKRDMIDRAFKLAYEKLLAMDAVKARGFFIASAVKSASGDEEVITGANRADIFGDGFIQELNAAMEQIGKRGGLTLSQEKREGVTGLILKSGGAEIHITYEAIMESVRDDMETEVASALFPEA